VDKYRIESHKLNFHVDRVHDWLAGKNIYPIYVEISPCGACNHRCLYCALDFMGYPSDFLDKDMLKERLFEMGRLGVKSIMYAGEGEPLLHRHIGQIILDTKKARMDVAVTTNGVLFDKKLCEATLPHLSWIKVSMTAGTKKTYVRLHQAKPDDFDRVMKNMSYAARLKRRKGLKCALGIQIILLPENYKEIALLARKVRDIGMDYLVVKPYSQHPFSKNKKYKNIKYAKYLDLDEKLGKLNNDRFNVIFRIHTMKKWDEAKHVYQRCLALPFWAYIDSRGFMWGCANYLTRNEFYLGDIYKSTFKEIWWSQTRKAFVAWAQKNLDSTQCRVNCRMDEVNRYLWELTHPPEHVNFI
jgi:cyclic pyranopterin phosphate synthase